MCLALGLLLGNARTALAQDFEDPVNNDEDTDLDTPFILKNPPVAPDPNEKAPELTPEELEHRRTSNWKDVEDEEWYFHAREVFIAKCAGCHPAGTNRIDQNKTLNIVDMQEYGYWDPDKIMEIMRYGKGKMPGFATDCADKSDYTQCGVINALSEETLQDVRDFVINRANVEWKGRG